MKKSACVAAVVLAIASSSASAQTTTVLFNVFTPPASPTYTKVLAPWFEDIEKATEGRVKIQPAAAEPRAAARTAEHGGIRRRRRRVSVQRIPAEVAPAVADRLSARDHDIRQGGRGRAMAHLSRNSSPSKNPFNDVVLLGFFASPPGHIYNIEKKPIQSLAELKGKKSWSLPGMTAQAMGRTGASVVPGPGSAHV